MKVNTKGNFVAMNSYTKNSEWSLISHLMMHLRDLEK